MLFRIRRADIWRSTALFKHHFRKPGSPPPSLYSNQLNITAQGNSSDSNTSANYFFEYNSLNIQYSTSSFETYTISRSFHSCRITSFPVGSDKSSPNDKPARKIRSSKNTAASSKKEDQLPPAGFDEDINDENNYEIDLITMRKKPKPKPKLTQNELEQSDLSENSLNSGSHDTSARKSVNPKSKEKISTETDILLNDINLSASTENQLSNSKDEVFYGSSIIADAEGLKEEPLKKVEEAKDESVQVDSCLITKTNKLQESEDEKSMNDLKNETISFDSDLNSSLIKIEKDTLQGLENPKKATTSSSGPYRDSKDDLDKLLAFMADDAIITSNSSTKSKSLFESDKSRKPIKLAVDRFSNSGNKRNADTTELDELMPEDIRKSFEKTRPASNFTNEKDLETKEGVNTNESHIIEEGIALGKEIKSEEEPASYVAKDTMDPAIVNETETHLNPKEKTESTSSAELDIESSFASNTHSESHTQKQSASRITDDTPLSKDIIADLDATLGFIRNDRIRHDNERFRQENAFAFSKETLRPGAAPRTLKSRNFFTPILVDDFYSVNNTSKLPFSSSSKTNLDTVLTEYLILTPSQKTIHTKYRPFKNEAATQDLFTTLSNLEKPEKYFKSIMKLEKKGWKIIGEGGSGNLVVFEREYTRKDKVRKSMIRFVLMASGVVSVGILVLLVTVQVPDTKHRKPKSE